MQVTLARQFSLSTQHPRLSRELVDADSQGLTRPTWVMSDRIGETHNFSVRLDPDSVWPGRMSTLPKCRIKARFPLAELCYPMFDRQVNFLVHGAFLCKFGSDSKASDSQQCVCLQHMRAPTATQCTCIIFANNAALVWYGYHEWTTHFLIHVQSCRPPSESNLWS